VDIGSAVGREAGVREEQMMALPDFETSDEFTALERLVLRYAVAMTKTPVAVSDALFAELREHFDEAALVELTANIAWENYRARFNRAFAIEAQGFSEKAFCVLPEHA
jgi:alkylhydroperoxidase family enzyme